MPPGNRTETQTAQDRMAVLRAGLAGRIARYVGQADRRATAIAGLTLHRCTVQRPPGSATYQPGVAVIAQGRKRVELASRTYLIDESRFLLTSLDLPIISQVLDPSQQTPFLALMLRFDMSMVRELLREEIPLPQAAPDTPAMATAEMTVELLGACCRLVELLETPHDIPILSGLIQREIIYRILGSAEGARLHSIATLGDQSQRTARVVAWLQENYSRPLRVEALAQMAGMGVSTLHHHFRTLTAMSPLQYQKQLRLHAARSRMLIDGLDAASAAFEVGYESASQFSREYSRFFGQPPIRDIRNLRLTAPAFVVAAPPPGA